MNRSDSPDRSGEEHLRRLRRALRYAPPAERDDILQLARDQVDEARTAGGDQAVAELIARADLAGYAANYPPPRGAGRRWRELLAWTAWGLAALIIAFSWMVIRQKGGIPPDDIRSFPLAMLVILGLTVLGERVLGDAVAARWPGRLLRAATVATAFGVFFLAPMVQRASVPSSGRVANEPARIRVDDVDRPFVDDPALIGEWESVDFVSTVADFRAGERSWKGELFLRGIRVEPAGRSFWRLGRDEGGGAPIDWTRSLFLDRHGKTASEYVIRSEEGATYLLVQWKSGDYVFRGLEPKYYVLRRK